MLDVVAPQMPGITTRCVALFVGTTADILIVPGSGRVLVGSKAMMSLLCSIRHRLQSRLLERREV